MRSLIVFRINDLSIVEILELNFKNLKSLKSYQVDNLLRPRIGILFECGIYCLNEGIFFQKKPIKGKFVM